jgi:hypothetical protein
MDDSKSNKKSIYRNEKNRQDRLKAQMKYYYKNRENILAKRANREPPASTTVKPETLITLYKDLQSYLKSEGLIDP